MINYEINVLKAGQENKVDAQLTELEQFTLIDKNSREKFDKILEDFKNNGDKILSCKEETSSEVITHSNYSQILGFDNDDYENSKHLYHPTHHGNEQSVSDSAQQGEGNTTNPLIFILGGGGLLSCCLISAT